MKLCLLSIATAFLTFAAATPVLAPRDPVQSYRVVGLDMHTSIYPVLQAQPIPGSTGNFQLGWFHNPALVTALHFASDPNAEGSVLDTRNYPMVFQHVAPLVPIYRVLLLVNRDSRPLLGIESKSHFTFQGGYLSYKGKIDGWIACGKGHGEFDLYFHGGDGVPLIGCQQIYKIRLKFAF